MKIYRFGLGILLAGVTLGGASTARAAPAMQATGMLAICKTVPLGTLNPPSFSFTVQGHH